jgi:hypothetical protein
MGYTVAQKKGIKRTTRAVVVRAAQPVVVLRQQAQAEIPPRPANPVVAPASYAPKIPPDRIPPSPPVLFPQNPRRFLLIVNASDETVPFAAHLGDDVDVVAIGWHPRSRIDVKDAIWWQERNPRHRKFVSVPTMLDGQFALPYEAVGIVDDDVEPQGCTWSDCFKLGMGEGFDVFHPALTPRSAIAHEILRQEPGVVCKRVNYCDLIAVFFSRNAFARCGPHFLGAGVFSWGLPVFWGQTEKTGVLDATPVAHMRPTATGTVYRGVGTREHGISDLNAFMRRHGLHEAPHTVWERKTIRGGGWMAPPPSIPHAALDSCGCARSWEEVRYHE